MSDEQLVDMDTLEVFRSLAEEEFGPMMEEYISYLESTIPTINSQIPSGEQASVRLASHSVKSTSLQLGFTAMGKVARAVEQCCIDNNLAAAAAHQADYLRLAEATLKEARKLLDA